MSAYDLEEQERIDALKDWWAKWGLWVYAAIGAFVLGVLGMQGWNYYQRTQGEQAEVMFKSVQKIVIDSKSVPMEAKDAKKVSEAATLLADKFASTFYASEAQLIAAKVTFESGDLAAAQTHLQWVVDHGSEIHRNLARLRLANVLLDQKKYEDGLKLLDAVKEEAFIAMAADTKGDIYAAQGKRDEARAAYQLAVEKFDKRSPMKTLSQSKLDAFGGAVVIDKPVAQPADKSADKGAVK